ncbi:hypothetical protein [Phenylobacterium sp.]|uniref:hypothetical protein n=1 Tax=Phenylobacterium sp. TaxID=1871053 RepID=UPI0035618A22
MKIALALIGAASAAVLALPAQAAQDDSSCFLTRDMRNHTVGSDHTLYFDVGGRSVWRAEMSNNCLAGSTSSDPIVLRDRGGMGRICHKIDLDVGVRGMRCIVDSLAKLTPAEVAALPRKMKP